MSWLRVRLWWLRRRMARTAAELQMYDDIRWAESLNEKMWGDDEH